MQVRITIELADGSVHSFDRKTMPRHWKSWAMQQMPYGTTFTGCRFSVERIGR